jgi:hypothetical protein
MEAGPERELMVCFLDYINSLCPAECIATPHSQRENATLRSSVEEIAEIGEKTIIQMTVCQDCFVPRTKVSILRSTSENSFSRCFRKQKLII